MYEELEKKRRKKTLQQGHSISKVLVIGLSMEYLGDK